MEKPTIDQHDTDKPVVKFHRQIDYSKPNGNNQSCSNGWYGLPRNNHACRKCGARLGQQCKAETNNHKAETRA